MYWISLYIYVVVIFVSYMMIYMHIYIIANCMLANKINDNWDYFITKTIMKILKQKKAENDEMEKVCSI